MLVASWNEMYPDDKLVISGMDNNGYIFSPAKGIELNGKTGINNSLYSAISRPSQTYFGYWLASPVYSTSYVQRY